MCAKPSTCTINLNSVDTSTSGTNNQPQLTIDQRLVLKRENNPRIKLSNYNIPNSFYQVSTTLANNTFSFKESGEIAQTINLTSGWYTFSSFVSELQTQITAALITVTSVTVAYNSINGLLSITSDGITDIQLLLASNPGFAALSGFAQVDQSLSNVQTGTNPINLLPIRQLFLYCNQLKGMYQSKATSFSSNGDDVAIAIIDVANDFLDVSILYHNLGKKYRSLIEGTIPKVLTMECRDRLGNLIDFNGAPWSVQFEISY